MKENSSRHFADGSADYGSGTIGPSRADIGRAEQVYRDTVSGSGTNPVDLIQRQDSVRKVDATWWFVNKLPRPLRFGLQFGLPAAALAFLAACASGEKNEKLAPTSTQTPTPIPTIPSQGGVSGLDLERYHQEVLDFPFPDSEEWFLTGGPHADGLSHGVRSAEDFAPRQIVNCPGAPISNKHVTAAAAGEVKISGNENDTTDPNHSIVVIELESGLRIGYMHLANIEVRVGQHVDQGETLGNPSCEFPPGGRSEGVHLHFFILDEQGRHIPIAGFVLSGWQIHESAGNYQGIMTKAGLAVRTADRGRCGPDEVSIRRCGGIRNDLTMGEVESPVVGNQNRNMSLSLDGIDDGVKVEDSPSLHLSDGVTIEARIKLAPGFVDTDGGDAVLAKGITSEPYVMWPTFFKCPNREAAGFFNSGDWVCADRKVSQGQWVNLAVTFDRHTAIMYINGVQVATKNLPGGLSLNTEPLFIGLSPVPGDEDFAGEIDYVALWDRARSAQEIGADFLGIADVAAAQAEGLVALWEFNGNFADSTSNHNGGVPLGDAHLVQD